MIVVFDAAATEPITAAEARTFAQIDTVGQEPAPGVIAAALASPAIAGSVTAGAHRYLATFVTADGETQGGTVSAAVTVADAAVNGKVSLTAIPIGGALVTSRKLYRTATAGTTYLLLATISNNTATTYTDNIADASLGAEAPAINTTDDPLMGILIASARASAEQELRRPLITQTLDAYFDDFPTESPHEILLPPIQSVTSITYMDSDGATQTLAASGYTVDARSYPARVVPAYGESWPSTRDQVNAVTVRFVAGYGPASAVPQCVKSWMLIRIRTLWESRSSLVFGTNGMVQIPPSFVDSLLDSERVTGRII